MLDEMERLGLVPNATLHHFVHPDWFEALGGFTNEANIPMFVEWARTAYRLFGGRITMWATFNEPTCYTFCRCACFRCYMLVSDVSVSSADKDDLPPAWLCAYHRRRRDRQHCAAALSRWARLIPNRFPASS